MNEEQHEVIADALKGVLRDLQLLDNGDTATYVGTNAIEGVDVTMMVLLDESFPLNLPKVFIRPWDALGYLPHIAPDGTVCYLEREGLIIDSARPGEIAVEALRQAINLLSIGRRGENQYEFVDEFDAYWSYFENPIQATSILPIGLDVEEIVIASELGHSDIVGTSQNQIESFVGATKAHNFRFQRAIYLPIEPESLLIPPRHDRPFWGSYQIRKSIIPLLSKTNREKLQALVQRKPHSEETIVVSLPRPSGGHSLFGFRFAELKRHHPLDLHGDASSIQPISFTRLDQGFLLERGGGSNSLVEKHVLLVGCGAVGGRIAIELARAGVLRLTLVDDDVLMPENTFRHALGRSSWYQNKAKALKQFLELDIPFLQVRAFDSPIEKAVHNDAIDWSNFDLVIFAIGNPTIELAMNDLMGNRGENPPSLHTWLEPLGIGGHAILSRTRTGGCYRCLFRDDGNGMYNISAFAGRNQRFGRALNGCGSMHTPYGSLDAALTADLAVRLALDVLTGIETESPLRSWRGDATHFLAEGFRLSDRYGMSDADLHESRLAYVRNDCPSCSSEVADSEGRILR